MIRKQIEDKELRDHIDSLEKDEMVVFVMAEGRVRGALFHGTSFVNQMRLQQNTGILETMVLGQACLCSALMIPTMTEMEHNVWRYECDGPAKGFSVEADSTGFVRGYLLEDHIPIKKPLESWDLTPFLGNGTMTVTKIHPNDKTPQTSSVEILYKNITKDLAWYYQQSDQIQTAFNTSIFMDPKGRVTGAGGMFLQVLPATGGTIKDGDKKSSSSDFEEDARLIEKVENAFSACPSLGKWFAEKGNINDIVMGLFREFNPVIAVRRKVRYDCPCNESYFVNHLKSLSVKDIEDLKNNDGKPVEIVCRNCGSVYRISPDKL